MNLETEPTCKVCKKPVKPDDIVYRRFKQDGGSDIWHELCAPWHRKAATPSED